MNKIHRNEIEKLIAELCPNGVEFKELVEVCKIETGKLNANAAVDDGEYMFFTTAKEPRKIDKYRWDTEALLIAGNANVGEIKHYIGKFEAYQRTYVLTNFSKDVDVRFLFFSLSDNFKKYLENHTNSAAMTYIVLSTLEDFKIPLPPLAIQEEIVKILNSFTELEAELEAELESRKKQYEHYYKRLLIANDGVQITLNEVGKVSMCKRIFKNETLASGDIPFYKIGTFGKEPNAFISQKVYDEYRKKFSFPKKGDVLLSASGTIGRRVIYNGEPAYFQDSNIIWIDNDESKVLNKFLYYLYATVEWKTEGGTIQRLYNDNLKKVKISVPSLAEQERIVSILDKFDALVNDVSIGLPAELSARRQQYEYYRGKLLTFNEYAK